MIICSKSNQWLKLVRALLKGSKESQKYFIAEGEKVIKALLPVYKPLVVLAQENFEFNLEESFLTISVPIWPSETPSKILAIFERPNYALSDLQNAQDLIILDEIQGPGNLGSIIRTAVAAGWENLICLKNTANPFSPKVVRSSAGALGGLKIFSDFEIGSLTQILKENNFTLIYTSSHSESKFNEINFKQINKPCLILGNEGHGIQENLKQIIFNSGLNLLEANIPILKPQIVESLNVGIASALLMYKIKNLI